MLETREITIGIQRTNNPDHLPKLIKWKTEPMIRNHSIKATIKEILQVSKVLDVVKVGIVGEPATGKTTLAKTLAHLIHKTSEVPFAVRVFGEDEFLNLQKTLDDLAPANYVLIFDDLSFLTGKATKRQIEEVKNVVTKIRHLREDVKIILIYDYHYTLGLDKYLRQANFRYFTSVGSSEGENMLKIVGVKYARKIQEFQKMFVQMTTKHKATFRIGPKEPFTYNYKNPFVPCLFFNNYKLRYTVFPLRTWIEPICSICTEGDKDMHSTVPILQFIQECEAKLGKGSFLAAIRIKLFTNGVNVYSHTISRAMKYLDKALEKKLISMEELATEYKLELSKARLKAKLDGVLADEPIQPSNVSS